MARFTPHPLLLCAALGCATRFQAGPGLTVNEAAPPAVVQASVAKDLSFFGASARAHAGSGYGSLALGGIIATFAIAIRKELLIPVLCGIFLIENLSVVIQVGWFRYTKKKYGEGRRVFLMAPLHHHYQKQNMPESKITARFWIVGVLLAVITIVTLKVR